MPEVQNNCCVADDHVVVFGTGADSEATEARALTDCQEMFALTADRSHGVGRSTSCLSPSQLFKATRVGDIPPHIRP
jgi:hypothetical protein